MSAPDGIDLDRQIARMKEEFESCKILHGEGSEWAIEAGSILASLIELQDARITAALAEKDGGGWMPIETAPENEFVLVTNGLWRGLGKKHPLAEMNYPEPSEQWQDEHRFFIEHCGPKLIGWQPLPTLPTERKV